MIESLSTPHAASTVKVKSRVPTAPIVLANPNSNPRYIYRKLRGRLAQRTPTSTLSLSGRTSSEAHRMG